MGQFSLTMQTNTISISLLLLLAASCSNGGVVKRSIPDKPYKDGKELLKMKDASDAIKRSFTQASGQLDNLAKKIEDEVDDLARLSSYINQTDTDKVTEALAEALNIQNLLNDQRRELSGLAKETISKSDRIIKKLKETVSGERTLERGMRSMLRDMKNLLRFSETKLKEAKTLIDKLRERVSNVEATLRVFKGLIESVKDREAELKSAAEAEGVNQIFTSLGETVVGGIATAETDDSAAGIFKSVFKGIGGLAKAVVKLVNREDILPTITQALSKVKAAIAEVKTLKNAMEKEVGLIIKWKDAIQRVKNEVFGGNLKKEDDEETYNEIQEIIEDGDTAEITEAFESLKGAAQKYLNHVKRQCPECAE